MEQEAEASAGLAGAHEPNEGYSVLPPVVLPPHPIEALSSVAELKEYLRARGMNFGLHPQGVTLYLDLGEIFDHIIDVQWLPQQVRFIAVSGIDVPEAKLTEMLLAVERLNVLRGFPVWRVLPCLSATYTVTRNHDDTLSSRVFEYAVALLRDSLERDWKDLRRLAES